MTLVPKIIKNENEYEKVLERIEEIFDAAPGTPDFDEMELLVKLHSSRKPKQSRNQRR